MSSVLLFVLLLYSTFCRIFASSGNNATFVNVIEIINTTDCEYYSANHSTFDSINISNSNVFIQFYIKLNSYCNISSCNIFVIDDDEHIGGLSLSINGIKNNFEIAVVNGLGIMIPNADILLPVDDKYHYIYLEYTKYSDHNHNELVYKIDNNLFYSYSAMYSDTSSRPKSHFYHFDVSNHIIDVTNVCIKTSIKTSIYTTDNDENSFYLVWFILFSVLSLMPVVLGICLYCKTKKRLDIYCIASLALFHIIIVLNGWMNYQYDNVYPQLFYDIGCNVNVWILNIAFTLLFVPLFASRYGTVRVERTRLVFDTANVNQATKKVKLMVLGDIIIFIVFTIIQLAGVEIIHYEVINHGHGNQDYGFCNHHFTQNWKSSYWSYTLHGVIMLYKFVEICISVGVLSYSGLICVACIASIIFVNIEGILSIMLWYGFIDKNKHFFIFSLVLILMSFGWVIGASYRYIKSNNDDAHIDIDNTSTHIDNSSQMVTYDRTHIDSGEQDVEMAIQDNSHGNDHAHNDEEEDGLAI